MATFADSLKREVARIARKEMKEELAFLRKSLAAQRSEIAALKRNLRSLVAESKALSRRVRPAHAADTAATKAPSEARKKPGRQVVYSAERFAVIKEKLGLTQAQLAQLLDVSTLSVYKWLKGEVEPREKQQEKILALRSLGKREVAQLLASKD